MADDDLIRIRVIGPDGEVRPTGDVKIEAGYSGPPPEDIQMKLTPVTPPPPKKEGQ